MIEWKGGHRLPGQDQLPVDLRVDHVFLVSCKYASKILLNAAPTSLFGETDEVGDWFSHVATEQHQTLYALVREEFDAVDLPPFVGDLATHHRAELKVMLRDHDWGDGCAKAYLELTDAWNRFPALLDAAVQGASAPPERKSPAAPMRDRASINSPASAGYRISLREWL